MNLEEASRKEAAKRVLKAETLLYRAAELMQKAQTSISVILGLKKTYPKIGALRENLKKQIYDLERCRANGHLELDSTMFAIMEKKKGGR